MQYLLVPQRVVRQPHDDCRARVFKISLSFAVHMIFELVVDLVHVYSSYRGVESLVPFFFFGCASAYCGTGTLYSSRLVL